MKNKTIFVFTMVGGLNGIILGFYTVCFGFIEANTSNMIITDETFVTLVFLGLILGGVLGVAVGCFLGRHFSTKWANEEKVLNREWKGIRIWDGVCSIFVSLAIASVSTIILMIVSSILEELFYQSSFAAISGQILRVLALWASFGYGWYWLLEKGKPEIKWKRFSSGYDYSATRPLYDENYNPISYDYLPNSSDSYSSTTNTKNSPSDTTYHHDTDLFGNSRSRGDQGTTYRHTTDIFGNKVSYGSDGSELHHGKDLLGNEETWSSDGKTYRHSTDIFGNEVTYGSDGSEYIHDKDILGNSRTRKVK